jgi:hypothetical protein
MDRIDPQMKVADAVDRHPETVDGFLRHECPDVRSGLFRSRAQIMSVRGAVWIHGIPRGTLIRELNDAVGEDKSRSDEERTGS